MTSNRYCGGCGSFDLVVGSASWISSRVLKIQPRIFCHGCDKQFSENDFTRNSIRTVPLTFDDFFFQTNIRNKQLQKKQIQPLTHFLGVSLIVGAVSGLLFIKLPGELQGHAIPQIEWAKVSSLVTDKDLVKKLQREFGQLVKAK